MTRDEAITALEWLKTIDCDDECYLASHECEHGAECDCPHGIAVSILWDLVHHGQVRIEEDER